VRRLLPYARQTPGEDDGPIVVEQLRYAAQVGLANAVMFLNSRIDVFIIMAILGQSALGIYSIGIAIGEMLYQLTRPIVTASFGRIARGDRREASEATAACMRHSIALTIAGAAVIAALTPLLVPLVYGKAFAGAVLVTELLLPGVVAYSMMGALATFFSQQLGEPKVPLYLRMLSAIICAVVTILALPRFGIAGGAVATSVSYLVTFTLATAYFCRQTGMTVQRLFLLSRQDLTPYRSALSYALRFTR
jgi:O-antigen/teichoic acid export membrane protein